MSIRRATSALLIVLLGVYLPSLASADSSGGAGFCSWRLGSIDTATLPEGPSSYIIKCITSDGCGELAGALKAILGDSAQLNLLRGLGLLTGTFDSSIIKMLCKSADLKNLIDIVELDQVVGYDNIIA